MDKKHLRIKTLLGTHENAPQAMACLVLSDLFYLETQAPIVELLSHPDTYSNRVR